MRHHIFLFALAATSTVAVQAVAMEPIGTISASIDGGVREWQTLAAGEGEASATVSGQAGFVGVTIQGHQPEGPVMEDVLSISVGYLGSAGAGAEPFEVTVALFPEGMSGGFWSTEEVDPAPEVTFTRLDVDGGRAEGAFAATLCYKSDIFAPADPEDCREIEGSFDTALHATD